MNKDELIVSTAKDLFLKLFEVKFSKMTRKVSMEADYTKDMLAHFEEVLINTKAVIEKTLARSDDKKT